MFKGYEKVTAFTDEERTAVREAGSNFCHRQRPALYGAAAKTYVSRLLSGYIGPSDHIQVSLKGHGSDIEAALEVEGKVVKSIPVKGSIYQSLDKEQFQAAVNDVMKGIQ